ncbi:hypothetical protein YC2023_109886 [Brassica napus]
MTTAVRSPDTASSHNLLLDKKTNKIRCFPVLDTAFSPDQSLETLQTLKPCKEHCPTKLATWSSSSPLRQLQDIREEIMFINDFPKMVAGAKGDCVPTAKNNEGLHNSFSSTSTYTTWSSSFQLQPI